MRLLLVGSQMHWAIEHHYLVVLRQEVEALEVFPGPDFFAQYYQGWPRKIAFRLGLAPIYRQINRDLLARIAAFKPDVIWIWKGMEIFPQTLQTLRQQGIKLVNYNPDHPFILSGRGSGNRNVRTSVPHYDLHFCYHQPLARQLKQMGLRTAPLPFGYSYTPEDLAAAEAASEILRIAFIGNPDALRVQMINALLQVGLPVDVYGNHWERHLSATAGLQILGPIYGQDFWVAMRRYRVQLNIFRPHNLGSHNMRSFEIPGIGGIMLAPDSAEHRAYFEAEQEVLLYHTTAEAVEKAQMLLALSEKDARQIRHAAFQRSVKSGYTYTERAFQALRELGKLHQ